MAVDFGRKRCGIAVTDPLCIIANPLTTVATHELVTFITGYAAGEPLAKIVVGLPTTMRGEASESQRWLRPAIEKLRKALPDIPIVYYDERFTSVLAHRAMIDGGMKKMARRDREMVDKISASIILNDYLASASANQ